MRSFEDILFESIKLLKESPVHLYQLMGLHFMSDNHPEPRCSTTQEALDLMLSSSGCPSVLSMVFAYILLLPVGTDTPKRKRKGGKHCSAENGKRERICNLGYEIGNVGSFFSLTRIFAFDF